MKIAILTPGGVDRSGTERVIPCLLWHIERLARGGDDVHVFALRQEAAEDHWPLLGASIHNAGGRHAPSRAFRALRQIIAEHRRKPFDIIHALWAVPQGVLAAVAGRILGVPVLLHLPGGDLARLPDIRYGGRLTPKGRTALRMAVRGADRIAAPSAGMVRHAQSLRIPCERLPFGVALDRWPPAAPRRRREGEPAVLLHVADLSPVKDQETLLLAAVRLREMNMGFTLQIVGTDNLQGAIHSRAWTLGLAQCVSFIGFLDQVRLKEWMYAADLLVVSSRHEAGPIVALEAAAAGVPAVGTDVGFLAEWAPEAARVVDCGDSAGLAREIAALLTDEDQRLLLAARAQKKATGENADATTRRIRNLYIELARGAQKRPRERQQVAG